MKTLLLENIFNVLTCDRYLNSVSFHLSVTLLKGRETKKKVVDKNTGSFYYRWHFHNRHESVQRRWVKRKESSFNTLYGCACKTEMIDFAITPISDFLMTNLHANFMKTSNRGVETIFKRPMVVLIIKHSIRCPKVVSHTLIVRTTFYRRVVLRCPVLEIVVWNHFYLNLPT